MNLKAITSALLLAGFAASPAFAESGTINFTGSIANVTCTINGGSNAPLVADIGSISAGDLANVGDRQGKASIVITVGAPGETSCPNGTKVWARFDEDPTLVDLVTGMVKVTPGPNAAAGVQIRLFNENNEAMHLKDDQKIFKKTVQDNQATIVHTASYEAIGPVTAGTANGLVRYTVNYEPAI